MCRLMFRDLIVEAPYMGRVPEIGQFSKQAKVKLMKID